MTFYHGMVIGIFIGAAIAFISFYISEKVR